MVVLSVRTERIHASERTLAAPESCIRCPPGSWSSRSSIPMSVALPVSSSRGVGTTLVVISRRARSRATRPPRRRTGSNTARARGMPRLMPAIARPLPAGGSCRRGMRCRHAAILSPRSRIDIRRMSWHSPPRAFPRCDVVVLAAIVVAIRTERVHAPEAAVGSARE